MILQLDHAVSGVSKFKIENELPIDPYSPGGERDDLDVHPRLAGRPSPDVRSGLTIAPGPPTGRRTTLSSMIAHSRGGCLELLPAHPQLHPAIDLRRWRVRMLGREHRPCVLGRLQQPGYELGLKVLISTASASSPT